MESTEGQIEDDEVLLRRIQPSSSGVETICERSDGGRRATSAAMSTRKGEDDLSCSRLKFTSPHQLLDDLRSDGIEPSGWHVCKFRVSDVKELDLEIAFTPNDRDPGHCSITAENGLAFPNNKAQKLAKRTRILGQDEVGSYSQR